MPGDDDNTVKLMMQMLQEIKTQSAEREKQHEARYDEHKAEQERIREQLAESNAKLEQQLARVQNPAPAKVGPFSLATQSEYRHSIAQSECSYREQRPHSINSTRMMQMSNQRGRDSKRCSK